MKINTVAGSDGRTTLVLTDEDGDVTLIPDTHPNYLRIVDDVENEVDPSRWLDSNTDWFEGVYADCDPIEFCVECGDEIDSMFFSCSCDEPTYSDSADYITADDFRPGPVIESLSATIERYRREERDPTGLVRFMHRLAKNPSFRSREELWRWSVSQDLTIDPDGYIIGFKGVSSDLNSINQGTAFVNGVEVTGHIPNKPGTVISMPRAGVQDDPTKTCSTGLHVGAYAYAKWWGSTIIEVRLDPEHVVSVPTDSGGQKLRCCQYEVIGLHDDEVGDDLTEHEPEAQFDTQEAFDAFSAFVPEGWLAKTKARLFGRKS